MSQQPLVIPTAQLFLGSQEETAHKSCLYLQSIFCLKAGCGHCIICTQIDEKKYASCLWLTTKKHYSLDDLVPLQSKVQFNLDPEEKFFFIIESAELLSLLSANALLKSLEEPPFGYYFLLLAKESSILLPTIISRCVIFYTNSHPSTIQFKALYEHFTQSKLLPSVFLRELEHSKITEEQTEDLIKHIIEFWQKKYEQSFLDAEKDTLNKVSIQNTLNRLYRAIETLPNSGNAKLFWKDLLLQFDPLIER